MAADKIEHIQTASLIPYARNARQHSPAQVAQIAGSIRAFGFNAPVLIDADNGIIAGHGRVAAALTLGLESVPCLRLTHLSDPQRRAYILADNRIALSSTWDEAMLALELTELQIDDVDLGLTGFSEAEIAALTAEPVADQVSPAEEGRDETPALPSVPVTVQGDVWVLGPHRIVCGDCKSIDDVQKATGGRDVNVAFTSPPYASQRKYDEASGFKPVHPDEYVEWFSDVQSCVRSVLAEDGSWFVNIKEHAKEGQRHLYVKDLAIAHVRSWGWMLRDELCWHKTGVPGSWPDRFRNDWEPIFHFSCNREIKFRPESVSHASKDSFRYQKSPSDQTFGGNISIGKCSRITSGEGSARPGNVIKISTRSNPNENSHEAAFPPDLPMHFILAFSDAGDLIYDPFMGSGSTLIAAECSGRVCCGTEISPRYVDVAVLRWQNMTGKVATLESTGQTFEEARHAR